MGEEADNKFRWVIKKFSSLGSERVFSDIFVVGSCKWRLMAYPKGVRDDRCFSLFLVVADFKTLPCGWKRHTRLRLNVVNQLSEELSILKETQMGFLVNDEVKIVVEVDVVEVIGKLEESEEATQPLKKVKLEAFVESKDLLKETSSVKEEIIDVNGFHVLPSQVEFVSPVFERYPEIASVFQAKKQHLRTACMYVLLSLIETLCKSLEELCSDDLVGGDNALQYLKFSGFKVDWLEKKLEEIKVKKKDEQIGESRMQELEEELKLFKKCSDIEALMETEKTKLLVTRGSPLTLDDVL
ncbi:unnamed protein product [Arabidopsis lyrata]|uniref:MATH domain-containing protein n=1 Tax=Arabidopsis lyrata subsp. lyrata TaxID=81972 RepID=D7LW13_ARALL|nr:MATH domain and coiled-coil domain-containing protein At3g58200 [Arabidopsis lyrata subsp. lyrata]EFH54453.1 hypothetical protein ARALYDRAFT_486272 [Arabidopsis lyrata subsp. lyrata]CAH8269019.1 unnamed protein product [Arabidopsis lyrata]|eukprot:XP_002878194.1 MATH domain and coiled-coil domain-containing protein At3g58200 [Arabidopsis lyrata subsp. lyrata]